MTSTVQLETHIWVNSIEVDYTKASSDPSRTTTAVPFAIVDSNVMSVPTLFQQNSKGSYCKFVEQSFVVDH